MPQTQPKVYAETATSLQSELDGMIALYSQLAPLTVSNPDPSLNNATSLTLTLAYTADPLNL